MDVAAILLLVKGRLGMTSTARDGYITAMIDGILSELEEVQGLTLSSDRPDHIMFVVDYTHYRYINPDGTVKMPRNLQFRLHNLIIKKAGTITETEGV